MSTTAAPTPNPFVRIAWWIGILLGAGLLLFVGMRVGQALFAPGPAESFTTELQEIRTTDGNYLGRIVADDGEYIRLADPATVTALGGSEATAGEQFVVQRLATEPFGLVGDLLVNVDQVIFVGAVANDSQLAAAYADASQSGPTPSESTAP